jgi:hypothetical protein
MPNPEVMTASEVKSHSSIDRFLVVFHSPTGRAGNRTATLPIGENGRCVTVWIY